ncbi:MAG: polysaccharide deacetylase family protein [Mangrovibacterium sp.]
MIRRLPILLLFFIPVLLIGLDAIGIGQPDYFPRNCKIAGFLSDLNTIRDSQGAIVRMDTTSKKVYLIFSAHDLKEGAKTIVHTLKDNQVKASFFLTGEFYADPENQSLLDRLILDGHFLGAHSDRHLLYADWKNRDSLLIDRRQFESDLKENYRKMGDIGIDAKSAKFFLPPYEWYNKKITDWSGQLGLTVINFTPGIRTNADYTTPDMPNYISSDALFENLKQFEKNDPHGLNGCIILIHMGTDPKRIDKFYKRLDELIKFLKKKDYQPERFY